MDKLIETLNNLNDQYESKIKNFDGTFKNQKEIVDLLTNIDYTIEKMHTLTKSMNKTQARKLESLCDPHNWEVDDSMWDSHTQMYCTKCGKYR